MKSGRLTSLHSFTHSQYTIQRSCPLVLGEWQIIMVTMSSEKAEYRLKQRAILENRGIKTFWYMSNSSCSSMISLQKCAVF